MSIGSSRASNAGVAAGLTVAGLLIRLLAAYYFIGLLGIAPLDVGSDAVQYHNLALGIMRGELICLPSRRRRYSGPIVGDRSR